MKVDKDTLEEILVTITRNKTRSLLTAFGVFWGIFMLMALSGGGRGVQESLQHQFEGFATNSAFVVANKTNEAYKGFTTEERAGTAYTCGKPEYAMYQDGDYCPMETGEVEDCEDCYYGVK